MKSLLEGDALPEKPEHQRFLLEMPDDTTATCLFVQDLVRERLLSGDLICAEMVAAVKEALHLPKNDNDLGSTIVIINSIRETIDQCGFASPEIIFQKLSQRKGNLQAGSKK